MRIVVQRVIEANVLINNEERRSIGEGMVVLLGIEEADSNEDIEWLSGKIVNLRIFDDKKGIMNLSLKQIDGEILLVSQFTLQASTKKGNRPSYIKAAKPSISIPLYESMIEQLEKDLGKKIVTGTFGADMKVSLCNNGPVTILIDSKNKE